MVMARRLPSGSRRAQQEAFVHAHGHVDNEDFYNYDSIEKIEARLTK